MRHKRAFFFFFNNSFRKCIRKYFRFYCVIIIIQRRKKKQLLFMILISIFKKQNLINSRKRKWKKVKRVKINISFGGGPPFQIKDGKKKYIIIVLSQCYIKKIRYLRAKKNPEDKAKEDGSDEVLAIKKGWTSLRYYLAPQALHTLKGEWKWCSTSCPSGQKERKKKTRRSLYLILPPKALPGCSPIKRRNIYDHKMKWVDDKGQLEWFLPLY